MTDTPKPKREWLFVCGPCDGERRVLQEQFMRWVVAIRPQIPMVWDEPDNAIGIRSVEYVPVRGIPGVMAPHGTSPDLVMDMLVKKYHGG